MDLRITHARCPPILLLFAVLVTIFLLPTTASSPPQPEGASPTRKLNYDFDVHLGSSRKLKLGIHLSSDLYVLSFEVNHGKLPWIHDEGGVREGDRLVFVDDLDFQKKDLKAALRAIKRAKTLTFRPREDAPRDVLHAHSPKQLKELHVETNQGHIDLMQGHLVLFSVPVMIADFSGKPPNCYPRKLKLSKPVQGCATDVHDSEDDAEHKYLVAERGGCSFSAKGVNAVEQNAAGLIIINQDNRLVEMPIDSQLISDNLNIPVVMISRGSANEIMHALDSHSHGGGGVSARLAITSECLKGDAAFHKKFNEEYEQEQKAARKSEADHTNNMRSPVNAKGERRREVDVGVNSEEVLVDYESSKRWTKRESVGGDVAIKLREDEGILSGELLLEAADGSAWEIEFLTVPVGGYLPPTSGEKVEVVVVEEADLVDCVTPQPAFESVAGKSRIDRALLFRGVECKEWQMVALAHRLRADVLFLYGEEKSGTTESGWVDDLVPMEAEESEIEIEYATHFDPDFNQIVEHEFKAAVVTISSAAAKLFLSKLSREGGGQTVRFRGDNFVDMAWKDIGRLREVESWPHSEVQRDRLMRRMMKVHGKFSERREVLDEFYGRAATVWESWGAGEGEQEDRVEVSTIRRDEL